MYGTSALLPSEISRLVFGYLGATQCHRTKAAFLQENSDLRELSAMVEKKMLRCIELKIGGLTLVDILNEHSL
jgi:hypothetical protein